MYRNYLKRLMDFTLGVIGTLGALPLLILTGILLAIANRGTPFFLQKRRHEARPLIQYRFDQKLVWQAILDEYIRLINSAKIEK